MGVLVVMAFTVVVASAGTDASVAWLDSSLTDASDAQRSTREKEYKVKALALWHFARFTTWPKGTFAKPTSPIVFGIVGKDPFGTVIDKMLKGKKVGKRPIVIRRFSKVEDVKEVHLLFVGKLSRKERELVRKRFEDKPVLTVGDEEGLAGKGVQVGFFLAKKKVRFEWSMKAIRSSKLVVSSLVLQLARIVDDKDK